MPEIEQRLDKVEERLGSVEVRLGSVEKKVDALDGKVVALDGKVVALDGKVAALAKDVQKLRVLGEDNARQIKLVAEVQALHGTKLEKIEKALEPLAKIDAFVQLVAHNHEVRIVELEKRTGVRE